MRRTITNFQTLTVRKRVGQKNRRSVENRYIGAYADPKDYIRAELNLEHLIDMKQVAEVVK